MIKDHIIDQILTNFEKECIHEKVENYFCIIVQEQHPNKFKFFGTENLNELQKLNLIVDILINSISNENEKENLLNYLLDYLKKEKEKNNIMKILEQENLVKVVPI